MLQKNIWLSLFLLAFSLVIFADKVIQTDIGQNLVKMGLINIQTLDRNIQVELKYAQHDNFLHSPVYGELKACYLQKEVAYKLIKAQKILKESYPNLNLLIYDCARPRSIQYKMWEIVKNTDQRKYVANPAAGSIHNYGCAVDLTIADKNNTALDMGTPFDYFGDLAEPRYEERFLQEGKLNLEQLKNRKLLRKIMEAAGFIRLASEWWHFDAYPRAFVKKKYQIIE